eukprot:COSAG04_NODE_6086_length_1415_cov_1.192249_2_plen_93_part_00
MQGCPADQGWHHAASEDLVKWTDRGLGPKTIHETYGGMDSMSEPCSGFVTVDVSPQPPLAARAYPMPLHACYTLTSRPPRLTRGHHCSHGCL